MRIQVPSKAICCRHVPDYVGGEASIPSVDVSAVASLRKRVGQAATSLNIIGLLSVQWSLVFSSHFGGIPGLICALLTPGCAFIIAKRLRSGSKSALALAAAWCSLWVGFCILYAFPRSLRNGIDVILVMGTVLFFAPVYFLARGLFASTAYRARLPADRYKTDPLALHPWEEGLHIKKGPRLLSKKSVVSYVLLALSPLPYFFLWLSHLRPDATDYSDDVRAYTYSVFSFIISVAALAWGACIYRRARREAMLPGSTLIKKDARAPVLYLRSFRDDSNIKVRARASNGRILLERLVKIPFEELVTDQLWRYGPVLALGDPQTQGQPAPLGAARDYADMAGWEKKITELIQQASMILAIAGGTHGLRWEIDGIARLGFLWKLVILLPPLDVDALNSRWQMLRLTSVAAILPSEIDLLRARAVIFREGQAVLISGSRRNDWTYEAVLDEAALLISRRKDAFRSDTSTLRPTWRTVRIVKLAKTIGEVAVTMISGALIVACFGIVFVVGQKIQGESHPYKFSGPLRGSYVTAAAKDCQELRNVYQQNRDIFCDCVANRMADTVTYNDLEKLETDSTALMEKFRFAASLCEEAALGHLRSYP